MFKDSSSRQSGAAAPATHTNCCGASEIMVMLCRGIKSGTVWVNCWNVFDAAVPFGGYKLSGIGREHGEEVLDHYTQVR